VSGVKTRGRQAARDGESLMAKSSKKRKETPQNERQTKKQIARSRKEAQQNRIIFIAVGILAAIIVLIMAFGVLQELVLKPGQPVATVNGVNIRLDDYRDQLTYNRYNQYVAISNLQSGIDELSASPEENDFLISFYEQQLQQQQSSLIFLPETTLDEIIDDELIRQKAEEEDLTVTAAEVEQAINDDIRSALSPTSQEPVTGTEQLPTPTPVPQERIEEVLTTIVDNMQISEDSFRAIVQRNLLANKVQELLASQVPTRGLVADVNLIQTESEQEALDAQQRIQGGEEFAVVAQEVSTDTVTAADGGSLGWVTTGQLSSRYGQALEDYVFASDVGALGVVESDGMFYVVLVADRDENGPLPDEVLNSRQNSALSDWLEERKASPDVEIERLLDSDQIPPDPFASTVGF
jgi:parvulin-like peptidyl-prolyl isomerase